MKFANEGTKKLWKRQHGMLKCKICGKKLKKLPPHLIYEGVNDGKLTMAYLSEYSGYSGFDTIDTHLKCLMKEMTKI